ncbi:abscisic acid receptor PYL4-like [Olea europaea var. sylvestris]|uniref:abscisic acid receptor PYL4-like n=1 Tax=Olea europaea var. sylvestris TaxID=158386 RepID=UPI000C1CF8FB|nr:abscisic acid receptor PYL4-like [Olea europaea var. sylvestris]
MPMDHPKSSVLVHRINTTATDSTAAATWNNQVQQSPSAAVRWETPLPCSTQVPDHVARYHTYAVGQNQCCSAVIRQINAPVDTVWSFVRRFDNPQSYKHFVKSCRVVLGNGDVGTLREIHVISGIPAVNSTERLEILDDDHHVISFSVVGGDHRLANYRSVTTLHQAADDVNETTVVESYVVDIPQGNTKEETGVFVDTIVKCNLQSLAQIAENLSRQRKNSQLV